MADRPGMKVDDNEHTVQHHMLAVGSAPDFRLVANDRSIRTPADYVDIVKILSAIPSIDTGVCSAQTRRFNLEAANNEGIERTETLSTFMDMKFADDYGVHDVEWRMCQRSVFVLDRDNIIGHAEYVPIMVQEVDFDSALSKAKELV